MVDESCLLEREAPALRLEEALAAARAGHGRIVSIEGEAGIGKTSLILSFAEVHRRDARVHIGGCEHLATPEPLGPLRDIARESQGRFSMADAGQLSAFEALLRLLTSGRGPSLLVIEDIHWADDSTLDLLRYLGRRIRTASIMVAVTFRNDEPASQTRLASLWADMPRDGRERIELAPLSLDAVSVLAHAGDRMAREVFEATGGNPFHVTEYLATGAAGVPRAVQDSTIARASSLGPRGRCVLDWAAIFPRQIDEASLRFLAQDADSAGVEECLRTGMLNAQGGVLAFRHELARRAIQDAMSPLRRREMHAAALAMLKGREGGRAAEAAHHAEQAGATQDLVAYSVAAADEAAALGAHREAVAHLGKAIAHGSWLADTVRADLLERQAAAGEGCGAFEAAIAAIDDAVAVRRRSGDALGLGNALRISTRLHWLHGLAEQADHHSRESLEVLHGHEGSWQYAMAISGRAQIDMLSDQNDLAIARGTDAMRHAARLGRWDIYLHALTTIGMANAGVHGVSALPQLRAAISEARERGELDSLPRLYSCTAYIMAHERCYPGLFECVADGLRAAVARDSVSFEAYARGARATALLDLGRAAEAVVEGEYVVFGPFPRGIPTFPAMVALSRARVRLGLPEGGLIEEARALPVTGRDVMRLAAIAVADAEAHWLGERRADALRNLRAAYDTVLRVRSQPWALGETALWLAILGETVDLPAEAQELLSDAYRLHVAGRWREAAEAWRQKGCPYEQAIALGGGDEAAQREALGLFDGLGAGSAAARLRREMRRTGLRSIPSGPQAPRRNSPAGLTPRQTQVLTLLGEGLSNVEIAERLNTAAKTVEHHVGAILAAFEAPSRLRAVQIARERNLLEI